MSPAPDPSVTAVYAASSPLGRPRQLLAEMVAETVRSFALARLLLRLQLIQSYRHSTLGLLWAVVPTLVITLGVTLSLQVSDSGSAAGAGGMGPMQVHVAFGVVLMQTFVEAFNAQRSVFNVHLSLLQRMKFPVEAVCLAQAAETVFHFLVKLPVLLAVLWLYDMPLTWRLLPGVLACLPILLAGLVLGALVAPLSTLGKDLDKAMAFVPWVLFLATPVFYRTPETGPWAALQHLNPLTAMLDAARFVAYADGHPVWTTFWASLAALLLCLPLALLVCKLAPPLLAERLSA